MTYTVADIDAFAQEHADELAKSLAENTEVPVMMKGLPMILDLWAAGSWLGITLREHGAEDEEVGNICFVHGQRSFGRDTKEAAVSLANEYAAKGETEDKPGEELAEKIHNELLEDMGVSE